MSLLSYTPDHSQKGEVAWLLTIVSMLTIALGIIVGINTTSSRQALTTSSEAFAEVPGELPIRAEDVVDMGYDFTTFTGKCYGGISYRRDPIITRIEIRDIVAGKMFLIDPSTPAIAGKGDGNFKDGHAFDDGAGARVTWGLPDNADEIYVVMDNGPRGQTHHYYLRPEWLGRNEVTLTFYYDRILGPRNKPTEIKKAKQRTLSQGGCLQPNGSITPPVGTVTPALSIPPVSVTPALSIPPVSVTPGGDQCYEVCTTSYQCADHLDPASDIVEKMLCLRREKTPRNEKFGIAASTGAAAGFDFVIQDGGGGGTQDYPFKAVAILEDLDNKRAVPAYIPNTMWANNVGSGITTGPFKDKDNLSKIEWITQKVDSSLQGNSYTITLKDLPSKYEIVDRFCRGNRGECGNFVANNPVNATDKTAIKGITIVKNGDVTYGWGIRVKSSPVSPQPTTVIPTLIAKPPVPEVCGNIGSLVPTAVITAALADPINTIGWNQPEDPSKPVSSTNPRRTKLTLTNINEPFHPVTNPLMYSSTCAEPTGGRGGGGGSEGHEPCDPKTDTDCRCMPPSCVGRDCTTKIRACYKEGPSVVPSQRPSEVPSPAPSLTPVPSTTAKAQCVYNAMAFVEECKEVNPATGECMPIPGTNRYKASPISQSVLSTKNDVWRKWAPLNNRQAANTPDKRPDSEKPADVMRFQFIDRANAVFNDLIAIFPLFKWGNNDTEGISISPRQRSVQDVPVNNEPRQLLEKRNDIKIASTEELTKYVTAKGDRLDIYVPNEQYNNREDAQVKLFYDQDNYRIVPNGNKIYTCTNSIARKLQAEGQLSGAADKKYLDMTTDIGACNTTAYEANIERDTIAGVTVGCGQDIVYGWTLQKCKFNYDYVFVIDTSTTMGKPDTNLGGKSKIEAAMEQVDTFIDTIEASGSDSRVALVSFNNAVHVYKDAATRELIMGSNGYGVGVQTNGLVGRNEFDSVRAKFDLFKKPVEQGGLIEKGSCMRCGLDLAKQVLGRRSDQEIRDRHGVVIFLSDGLPNSYPGDAAESLRAKYPAEARNNVEPWSWPGNYDSADELRNDGSKTTYNGSVATRSPIKINDVFDDVLLTTITYGDPNKKTDEGQNFELFSKSIASEKAAGSNERWAYSTAQADGSPIDISAIFAGIQKDLNTCSLATLAFDISLKARDINNDGIVNLVDLFLVYESYFKKGDNLPEDINGDGVVNALDASLIYQSAGTVITSPQPTPPATQ